MGKGKQLDLEQSATFIEKGVEIMADKIGADSVVFLAKIEGKVILKATGADALLILLDAAANAISRFNTQLKTIKFDAEP